jgi:di/tricarboxylate transporter
LLLAVFLFVTEKLPVDLVALLVMGLLLVSGIIRPRKGFRVSAIRRRLPSGRCLFSARDFLKPARSVFSARFC